MKRREFITLLGGAAAAWPLVARAQQGERVRRIGVLIVGYAEDDPEIKARLAGFREGLEKHGWLAGKNVRIDARFASSGDRAQTIAKELVALPADVIVAHTTPAAAALRRETSAIPIVFIAVSDPVGAGLVDSLARPGGNLTGFLAYEASVTGKWLGMLKEIAPRLERAALLANPKTSPYDYFLRTARALAQSFAIELVPTPVETAGDVERAIESFAREPNGGLLVTPDTTTAAHRDLIVGLTARRRLPAVYYARFFVAAGGLMSYGINLSDQYPQAASYVDRILRGAKPAELPVQAPTRYETTLSLKTAKALGLTVPDKLLVAADEVIE